MLKKIKSGFFVIEKKLKEIDNFYKERYSEANTNMEVFKYYFAQKEASELTEEELLKAGSISKSSVIKSLEQEIGINRYFKSISLEVN